VVEKTAERESHYETRRYAVVRFTLGERTTG